MELKKTVRFSVTEGGMENDANKAASAEPTWEPISQVAAKLGCSAQWIRNWIAGRAGPALEARECGGKTCLQAEVAYQHILRHAKRPPPGLRPPAERRAENPPPPMPKNSTGGSVLDLDPHVLLSKVLLDAEMSNEAKKTLAVIAAELRRKAESDAKRETLIPPAEVIAMFAGLGDIVVEAIEAGAPKLASAILVECRDQLGVDMTDKNISANTMIQAVICKSGNDLIARVRRYIADELDGVRDLEVAG